MKVIFYNSCHNGDIHYSREFVNDIISKTNFSGYFYAHHNSPLLLKDIEKLIYKNGSFDDKQQLYQIDDCIYINTWIGQCDIKYLKKTNMGCSLYTGYEMFKDIYEKLNLNIENIEHYIPRIDWSKINTINIDNYIKNNVNNKILISNGNVLSGQSPQFSFDKIIENLSSEFPEYTFILTKRINSLKKNIIYTGDIIQQGDSDLNEISYLSKYCDVIVGRASGPFAFCHTFDNIMDKNKKFVSFTHNKGDSVWYDGLCEQIWSNDFNEDNIYSTIKSAIKK